eukprot:TRINITY_DN4986_c0_g1_i1.p2 TRINITY_DN4986_c0_g1~~TRINITY_DN4986_c0_g1_i1.p2  ORF type:complete len:117 (+),score=27.83 TRINITY_DN4986_c0_g1_i1:64-414(+)
MCIRDRSTWDLKAILINPSIHPYNSLKNAVGEIEDFSGGKFWLKESHLDELKKYEVSNVENQKNFLLLVQKGDKLLDYKEAIQKLPDCIQDIEEGGSHAYDGLEKKFDLIQEFMSK